MSESVTIDGCNLYTGDVMAVLPTLPDRSIHACVTSPPYFALRSYLPAGHAAKGLEIGSEPTPEAFIETMVAVFAEVRRVLRDDGVLWMNLGDSMSAGGRKGHGTRQGHKQQTNAGTVEATDIARPEGFGDGQLLNIPHRVAEALRQDGWIWRQTIVWAKRSPMPESVGGWRWQRCRVKVKSRIVDSSHKMHDDGALCHPSLSGYGGGENTINAEWSDCPGCPKCEPNGGYVLRRGSGRCTTAHEYIFLFAKTNRYFWDGEASREALSVCNAQRTTSHYNTADRYGVGNGGNGGLDGIASRMREGQVSGRNPRSVWTLSSEPSSEKHFAAFPSELVRRCLASSPATGGVCAACGAPFAPVVEATGGTLGKSWHNHADDLHAGMSQYSGCSGGFGAATDSSGKPYNVKVSGYRPTCACGAAKAAPVILDPFGGTGTVGQTSRQLGCKSVYIDLNPAYVEIAKRRILEPPRWWLRQQAKAGRPVKISRSPLPLFDGANA